MPLLEEKKEKQALRKIWYAHYNSKVARDRQFMPRYVAAMRVYYDQTLTPQERQLLIDRGQSDISINWLRALLRQMQAFMTANQPQWIALGIGPDDTRKAVLANAVLSHIWRVSKGYLQVVDLIKKGVIGGLGLWAIYVDYKEDNGLGEVKWRSLPVQYFYPDWRSKDPMYDDMAYQQISYTIDIHTAYRLVPKEYHDRLAKISTVQDVFDTVFEEGMLTYGDYPDPYALPRVRLVSHYQLEERTLYEAKDAISGETLYLDHYPEIPVPYGFDIRKRDIPALVRYDCVYGAGEDDGIVFNIQRFNYNKYLVKPFIDEYLENPYGVGEAYFLHKLQMYIDKSLRVALQHEMFNSNPGVFVPMGTLQGTNKEEFEKKVMWPGFVLEVDMENGQPIFKHGVPGQTGFYNIMNLALEAMRQHTGNMFHPEMARGNATEDQLLRMAGQEVGDAIFRNFEQTLEEGAKAALAVAKQHYGAEKIFKFVDNVRRKPVSVPVNTVFVNEQGDLDFMSITDAPEDVAIASRSYVPTEKIWKQKVLSEALTRAPAGVVDLLFIEFAKALEIDPDIVDEMQLRSSIIPQLQQALEQAQNKINDLESTQRALRSQVLSSDRSRLRAEYEAEFNKVLEKFKAEMRSLAERLKTKSLESSNIQ